MQNRFFFILTLCLSMAGVSSAQIFDVDSILAQMTTREKATLIMGGGWGSMFEAYHLPFCKGHRVPGAAGESRAIARLGVPSIIFSDGPAGVRVRDNGATAFPVGISLASTCDTALVSEVGRAIGEEARSYGIHVMLMPGMGLIRNPLCGRNYEYFSEDPVWSGQMAAAMVRGVQSAGVGTSVKHYALNNQETNRFHNDVVVDSATMHNLYLENFRIALEESEPWTVMSSYNSVNGAPVQRNAYLLDTVLRQQWGYEGVCLTDWTMHRQVAKKVAAGTDLLMPGSKMKIHRIVHGVRRGVITEERLNEAARRVLVLVQRATSYEKEDSLAGLSRVSRGSLAGRQGIDTVAHRALARRAGAAGCVLLRNEEQTLPLATNPRVALFGAHSYALLAGGTGSGYVNCAYRVSLAQGMEAAGCVIDSTLSADYEAYMSKSSSRLKVQGMSIVSKYMGQAAYKEKPMTKEAIEAACHATDVAIITLGRQAGEGGDRTLVKGDWYLTDTEKALIEDVSAVYHKAGKRVIVVLNVAGVIEMPSWREEVDAILLAWCPGQEGGHAITDILLGKVNPTGKLPVTIPWNWEDLPSSANFPKTKVGHSVRTTTYEEREHIGARAYETMSQQPAYPVGFGLSY